MSEEGTRAEAERARRAIDAADRLRHVVAGGLLAGRPSALSEACRILSKTRTYQALVAALDATLADRPVIEHEEQGGDDD